MTDILTLRTAVAPYPHVQALRTGAIVSPRVAFDFEDVPNITRAFRRMVRTLDFDLCEIALTTLAQAIAHGKPITGLPVVVMRGFHHGALVCPVGSSLSGPVDLRGKRIGVRAYSQTTGVWLRGILRDEYGVDHRDITWVTEEDAHVAEYADPPNVQRIGSGQDLRAMLLAGEIDAAIALSGLDPAQVRPVISILGWRRNSFACSSPLGSAPANPAPRRAGRASSAIPCPTGWAPITQRSRLACAMRRNRAWSSRSMRRRKCSSIRPSLLPRPHR